MPSNVSTLASPWPHRWAWLLACATFPLLWWGGLVTATGSGMAFKDWLTSDGVFMPLYPWLSSAGDKFIEHGHRLLGMVSGVLTLALVASLFRGDGRRWVRRFGLLLLLGVVAQGVLGGVRVKLDEHSPEGARMVALIHGCTGPLFFAAVAGMIVVTSRGWRETVSFATDAVPPAKVFRLALVTAGIAYLQLVLGAIVRHSPLMVSESAAALFQVAVYFHVLLALAVTFHVLLLAHRCFWSGLSRWPSIAIAGLIAVQLLLGVSTWMVKYGMPEWAARMIGETGHFNRATDAATAAIVTAHGAVGALLVAVCVSIAVQLGRRAGLRPRMKSPATASVAGAMA